MVTEKSKKHANADALADAVNMVNAEIERQQQKLQELAADDKLDDKHMLPLDGETDTGYLVAMQVPSSDVAKLALRHNYQVWNTLGIEPPEEMWSELAEKLGIERVHYVDIEL